MATVTINEVEFSTESDEEIAIAQLMLAEAGIEYAGVFDGLEQVGILEARWPSIGLYNGLKVVSTVVLSDAECVRIVNASLEMFDEDLREMAHLSSVLLGDADNTTRGFLNVYLAFHESVFGEVFVF